MKYLVRISIALLIITFYTSVTFAQSQDFYSLDKVQEVRIKFEQKNWASLLDSLRLQGGGLLLGDVHVGAEKFQNIGVRYRGSKSFKTGGDRNPLFVKLNYIDKTQNHQGYKTLKFSNSLRDPSMVREVLGYQIARKYMPAPKANYVRIYINDEYYGLFTNVEAINDDFLDTHFGSSDNTFVKCSPNPEIDIAIKGCRKGVYSSLQKEDQAACYTPNYDMKSDDGWDDLINLIEALNDPKSDIEKILNVDEVLWMLAFNNVVVNLSSYSGQNSQNFYLYQDDNGRFNALVWDLNLSFGSFKNTGMGSDLALKELQKLDPMLHKGTITKPLINRLLSDDHYAKIYLSHVKTILEDNFKNDWYKEEVTNLQKLIRADVVRATNWNYSREQFDKSTKTTIGKRSKIPGIFELMDKRTSFLKKNKLLATKGPSFQSVTVRSRKELSKEEISNYSISAKIDQYPKEVTIFYRFENDSKFNSAKMSDDGRNGDRKAGDGIFRVSIEPAEGTSKLEYYIYAENARAAQFYPTDYMFNPMNTSLLELNK